MELWKNPVIKSIVIIFLISVGIDITARIFFDQSSSTIQNKTNDQSMTNAMESSSSTTNDQKTGVYHQKNEEFYLEESVKRAQFPFEPISILLCVSCGYSNKLDEIRKYVQKYFPEVRIESKTYPIGPVRVLLGYLVRGAQLGLGGVMVGGDWVFAKLGKSPPAIYYKLLDKKMWVVMGVVMLGNSLASMVNSSGAFEVYYGGKLLHSKLASGEFPEGDFLVHQLYEISGN